MRSLLSLVAPIAGALFLARSSSAAVLPLQRRNDWGVPGEGGCWTDNADGQRALDKSLGGFDDMTPTKCQGLCLDQGFALAGVEFGRECFCGNTIFGNNQPSDSSICNMPCSGDASQTCGGTDALNVYVQNGYAFTSGPASLVESYNEYENPRCFHDSASSRILSNHPSPDVPADQMTIQKCIDGCAAAGYSSAGLEFGRECYCGNVNNPLADSSSIDECSQPCLGDASQYCGGANRLLLYHKPTTIVEPTPQGSWAPAQGGCWTDSVNDRALQHFEGGFDDLTPAKCQVLCENAGYSLAGVEFARECYCGNTIMGSNTSSGATCNKPCTGNGNQICGGADAINIYVKDSYPYTVGPASVLQSYNGYAATQCWQDDAGNRLLKQSPATAISYDLMTVQKCIDGCAAAGYSSAGVEYGGECFCDNVTFPPGQNVDMSECNLPCTGDASEFCGGANRILIYYNNPVPPSVAYSGIIKVVKLADDSVIGYLSTQTYLGIDVPVSDAASAETFTFTVPSGVTNQVEITTTNTIGGYPFLALISGWANLDDDQLGAGNWHYLFLGGATHTEPGAIPQTGSNSYTWRPRKHETSVWTIDTTTWDISGVWVNPDGSSVPVPSAFVSVDGQTMMASGDLAAFRAHFGLTTTSAPSVKFVFVPNP